MPTESQEHTFQVSSPATLIVKNIRGKVDLTPSEDGLIKIEVITYPTDGNPDDTRIELNQDSSGGVRAQVSLPENDFGIGRRKPMRVDFRIQAPVHTDIKARNVSGSVSACGFRGRIHLATVSGGIHAEDLAGQLSLESVSGRVEGQNLTGDAEVKVVSGTINLRQCDFPRLDASSVSGNSTIQTAFGPGPYKLSAVSGSLLLVVPKGSDCDVDASTLSGRFYTDLDVRQASASKRRWQVKIGNGGPQVRMNTVSGKMRLLTSLDARGQVPAVARTAQTQDARKETLNRLSKGEINVDEALKELAP
ncbi:MAG: DUF4097 family beta strand repeat protein [Anaerolineales bacterium]|nr:DUF4097 family beta strand repeat protein [Anaerolineales bacterium]